MTRENQQRNPQPANQPQPLRPESLTQQIARLQSQIEQGLLQHSYSGFEVRCDDSAAGSGLALTVLPQLALSPGVDGRVSTVPWSLDVLDGDPANSAEQKDSQDQNIRGQDAQQEGDQRLIALQQRAQAYANAGVAECWFLDITNVELRIYRRLSAVGYRQRLLVHEGETVSPLAFPQLRLTVQEPLPLFFLTLTTTGQQRYPTTMLPLRVSSLQSSV